MRTNYFLIILAFYITSCAKQPFGGNKKVQLNIVNKEQCLWSYKCLETGITYQFGGPIFEVDGKPIHCLLTDVKQLKEALTLRNQAKEYVFEGSIKENPDLSLRLIFRIPKVNPVVRFRYELYSKTKHLLTKVNGNDNLMYFATSFKAFDKIKEIRLSEFNEMVHSFSLSERVIAQTQFDDSLKLMGPLVAGTDEKQAFLVAYEHGSQVPDAFIQFNLHPDHSVNLCAVKGNYYNGQVIEPAKPYQTIWFEAVAIKGNETMLAQTYRSFILHDMATNNESRKPYIFYNTWNFQERMKNWYEKRYLDSMNLKRMLREIDVAHGMGIEVFVVDAGWFQKTGDWKPNTKFFPDTLKQVKAKLNEYGMKLGLWFNPMAAAVSSNMLKNSIKCTVSENDKPWGTLPIWETEESRFLCLVSSYRDAFANELIRLHKELGVTYFKLDAVSQYACTDSGHWHGTKNNSILERKNCYAFEIGRSLAYVVDKLSETCPDAIVDFDITEGSRAVGLGFLATGKYFLINNGPYSQSYDIPIDPVKGNLNLFFHPGPARGWICRTPLNFDKWIPSVLFLTHYFPDDPYENQSIAVGSLILGQNGIWGDLPVISKEGIDFFSKTLGLYKQVRDDITESSMITDGVIGGSPEVYEKINPENGKGAVVIFSSHAGNYSYITHNKPSKNFWATRGADVSIDKAGQAKINVEFNAAEAKIIFFGVKTE